MLSSAVTSSWYGFRWFRRDRCIIVWNRDGLQARLTTLAVLVEFVLALQRRLSMVLGLVPVLSGLLSLRSLRAVRVPTGKAARMLSL